jgi:site-specific DNA-methyltransferase (adenine-specific)
MTTQAAFTLRGHNPDVLSCIANLSSDEVFTPPEFAGRMLDTLAGAWAPATAARTCGPTQLCAFSTPAPSRGVFLREITRRLTEGLKSGFRIYRRAWITY